MGGGAGTAAARDELSGSNPPTKNGQHGNADITPNFRYCTLRRFYSAGVDTTPVPCSASSGEGIVVKQRNRQQSSIGNTALDRRTLTLPYWLCGAALLLGTVASVYAGWREYQNGLHLEHVQFAASADAAASAIQHRLTEREALIVTAGSAFVVDDPFTSILDNINPRLIDAVPDAQSFVWASRIPRAQASAALDAMRKAGITNPQLMGINRKPLAPDELTDPWSSYSTFCQGHLRTSHLWG